MYLITTAMPIHKEGPRLYISNSWYNATLLARDGWAAGFGKLVIIAPYTLYRNHSQNLESVEPLDGVEFIPVSDSNCRIDQFWKRERKIWADAVNHYLSGADVLHSSVASLCRPITQLALSAAYKAGVPTIFIGPDMDLHEMWKKRSMVGHRLYGPGLDFI